MNNEQNFFNTDGYSQDSYLMNYQDQYTLNNAAIREKLNLHVKRRLEATPFGNSGSYSSVANSNTNGSSCGSYDDSMCGPSKPKSKRGRKSKKTTSTVTSGSLNQETGFIKNHNIEFKSTGTSFINNQLNPPLLNTANNGHQHIKTSKIKDKEKNQEMDQFVKILNEKKLALMQDPNVINLLDHITMNLRAKKVGSI